MSRNMSTIQHVMKNTTKLSTTTMLPETTESRCPEGVTPVPYDHQGAMRFTVAVVLVYGVGVIGILGIYVRRRHSDHIERDANIFVKGLQRYRDEFEKKEQLSSVQKLITSIHGEKWKYSPASSVPCTPLTTPDINKQYALDNRALGSPGAVENIPLMSNFRRPVLGRGFSSYTIERQDSIQETEEEDEEDCSSYGVLDTPVSECSSLGLGRPVFTLNNPPQGRQGVTSPLVENKAKGDNSYSIDSSPVCDSVEPLCVRDQNTAKRELQSNGRFTVVNVHDV